MRQAENDRNLNQLSIGKEEKRAFYEALKRADASTIRTLAKKITPSAKRAAANARLVPQDAEELINDALVITINNIREGKFQFMDITPSAYASGVIRKLIANRLRTKKPSTAALTGIENVPDFSPEIYLKKKEQELLVGKLLKQLGGICQKLLRFKYFDSLKDAEIIERKLTDFTSINSLKSKRSQCLKRLTKLSADIPRDNIF